jgi:four helix bundle protein
MEKILSFTDLKSWQKGHVLVLLVYQVTKDFPKEVRFGIIDQLRRAVVSITCNQAEGFNRHTKKEKAHFYYTALGSVAEVQNLLLVARDLVYLNKELFKQLANLSVEEAKLVKGLIRSTNNES